ncbi:hypothetical protein GMRT_16107 [Giardia muris]|uniref:Uncharacterized protein n=1 Tax=Giardia muris TaxID=5742 RepID=A0A4Z1SY14_GIAMU|nr:hypothetical protein GMRT_16107 [Giardia muris]|eukprot:TNJ30400.1 hypothetical protein GMRT_16107 [Giardia muris]
MPHLDAAGFDIAAFCDVIRLSFCESVAGLYDGFVEACEGYTYCEDLFRHVCSVMMSCFSESIDVAARYFRQQDFDVPHAVIDMLVEKGDALFIEFQSRSIDLKKALSLQDLASQVTHLLESLVEASRLEAENILFKEIINTAKQEIELIPQAREIDSLSRAYETALHEADEVHTRLSAALSGLA